MLGMRNMFRGIVVKSWTGNNFETSADCKHNKMIVKESAKFYNEHWVDRWNALHTEEEQKKRLSQWCENIFDEMKNGECDERKHAERTELDIDRSENDTIKAWTLGALKMKRNLKKCTRSDVRRFFNGQR